jgi:hypothetical protein
MRTWLRQFLLFKILSISSHPSREVKSLISLLLSLPIPSMYWREMVPVLRPVKPMSFYCYRFSARRLTTFMPRVSLRLFGLSLMPSLLRTLLSGPSLTS